jgi:hypothetical protein
MKMGGSVGPPSRCGVPSVYTARSSQPVANCSVIGVRTDNRVNNPSILRGILVSTTRSVWQPSHWAPEFAELGAERFAGSTKRAPSLCNTNR